MMVPSFEQFKSVPPGASAAFLKKLDFYADPFWLYERFRGGTSVLLESARAGQDSGRYSLMARRPFMTFHCKRGAVTVVSGRKQKKRGAPLEVLKRLMHAWRAPSAPGFPPFTGGAVGFFAYEAKNLVEPGLPQTAPDDLGLPDIYLLFFDRGLLVDHKEKALWMFVTVKRRGPARRVYADAAMKLKRLERELRRRFVRRPAVVGDAPRSPDVKRVVCLSTAARFMHSVETAKRHIRAGDIFQANISQRFDLPMGPLQALEVYRRLRKINPSPFFGLLETPGFQIISGSPERLVKLENGVVETRPIAGTRKRGRTSAQDRTVALELLLNEKERAEHIMLVDLERNDLGRVAEFGSVSVDQFMILEDYSHVKHIVSNVRGVLRRGLDALDVIRAFFPGGTITGAPKVRCMEIIDTLEPVARGPYTGSLGYLSFTGNMDLNIIIRSLVLRAGRAHLQVGAGIVADSQARKEYEETLYKAEAVLAALFGEAATRAFFSKLRTAADAVG